MVTAARPILLSVGTIGKIRGTPEKTALSPYGSAHFQQIAATASNCDPGRKGL
jgi:hypothetical protein